MSEQELLNVSENTTLGIVKIAPEVIEVISGLAASEVEGLYAMRGNFASGVVERFGRKAHNKGVKVELTDHGIKIDVYSILQFGTSIPKVAQEIQSNIRQTLKNMTQLEIAEINIHVVGIHIDEESNESE